MKMINFICILLVSLISEAVFAVPTIGELAEKMIIGTDVLTRFMLVICIAMGVGLIIAALVHYKAHRFNPKMVPLDRPVFYLVLGIFLISLPFWGQIFAKTGSSLEILGERKQQQEVYQTRCRDIDAPLDWGRNINH